MQMQPKIDFNNTIEYGKHFNDHNNYITSTMVYFIYYGANTSGGIYFVAKLI